VRAVQSRDPDLAILSEIRATSSQLTQDSAFHRYPSFDCGLGSLAVEGSLPPGQPYRYAIFDREWKFDSRVAAFLNATGMKVRRGSAEVGKNGKRATTS
jgi:hypothetical protein